MYEEDISEINIDDSDDEQQYGAPGVYAQRPDQSFNETAESLKEKNELDKNQFMQLDPIVSEFCSEELMVHKRAHKLDENMLIFEDFSDKMELHPPNPPLYFLPYTIIIRKKVNLQSLREEIVSYYENECCAQVKRNSQSGDKLQVLIHNHKGMTLYNIKSITIQQERKHDLVYCFDHSLVLNPLFKYYSLMYDKSIKFSQTASLLLYWAYQRELLDDDYLPEQALKLLMICFFCIGGGGVENIIQIYYNEKQEQLQAMKKMYKISPQMEIILDKCLFDEEKAFAIRQQKGFYVLRQKKYSIMKEILPIPYPVTNVDFKKYARSKSKLEGGKVKSYSTFMFIRLLYFLNNLIQKSKNLKIDFVSKFAQSSNQSEEGFGLEIIHPVYEYNICQPLNSDMYKMKTVKYEIENAVKIFKDKIDPIDAMKEILQKKR